MNFLSEVIDQPINEKPFLFFAVGYTAKNYCVPDNKRKELNKVIYWY